MARWVVTFECRSEDLEGMEMRGFLKVALRRLGMRCVDVKREAEEVERRKALAEAVKRELAGKKKGSDGES